MGKMKEMQLLIEEVARVALDDRHTLSYVAHELGVDEQKLENLRDILEGMLYDEGKEARDLAARVFGFREDRV